jgi:hypothetical protein
MSQNINFKMKFTFLFDSACSPFMTSFIGLIFSETLHSMVLVYILHDSIHTT